MKVKLEGSTLDAGTVVYKSGARGSNATCQPDPDAAKPRLWIGGDGNDGHSNAKCESTR